MTDKTRRWTLFAILFALFLPMATGCGSIKKHDTLILKYNTCDMKWADYESELQRRHELIPNIVATVKAEAAHEKDTLTAVQEARSKATAITMDPKDFEDPEKFAKFQAAQGNVTQALGKLMMVQENYPNLKANQAFKDLRVSLESTENRLNRARKEYNKSVMEYNTELQIVGGEVLNAITGQKFASRVMFKASAAASEAPKVEL